jgi:hypothetical protein
VGCGIGGGGVTVEGEGSRPPCVLQGSVRGHGQGVYQVATRLEHLAGVSKSAAGVPTQVVASVVLMHTH